MECPDRNIVLPLAHEASTTPAFKGDETKVDPTLKPFPSNPFGCIFTTLGDLQTVASRSELPVPKTSEYTTDGQCPPIGGSWTSKLTAVPLVPRRRKASS
uniref:Uncharacterized protein n=1 Tax=Thalassionema nitzschioides TaxID=33649 RepID=A0A7S1E594_9STRA